MEVKFWRALGETTLEDIATIRADGAWRVCAPCHYPVESTATACEGNWHLEAVEWDTIWQSWSSTSKTVPERGTARKRAEKNWQATKVTPSRFLAQNKKKQAHVKYKVSDTKCELFFKGFTI